VDAVEELGLGVVLPAAEVERMSGVAMGRSLPGRREGAA
jgi:hypothetical protein